MTRREKLETYADLLARIECIQAGRPAGGYGGFAYLRHVGSLVRSEPWADLSFWEQP